MVSKLNNDSITRQGFADVAAVPQQEAENQVTQDQGTEATESKTSSAGSTSVALYAKGILDMEADLRRISVERDLDQPDMASAKTYQDQSDQDVSAVVGKRTEKIDP